MLEEHHHSQGFVLPLTLIILLILTIFAMGISRNSRLHLDDLAIRQQLMNDKIQLTSALQWIIYHLLTGQPNKNRLTSNNIRIMLDGESITQNQTTITVQDAAGMLGLGWYDERSMRQVLERLTNQNEAHQISSRIGDWIDKDSITRPMGGMEMGDYIRQKITKLPRNAPLRSLDELLAIPSVTPKIFNGHGKHMGLRDLLLAGGIGYINWATVPPSLLAPLLSITPSMATELSNMRNHGEWQAFMQSVHHKTLQHKMELMMPSNTYLIRLTQPSGNQLRVLLRLNPTKKIPYSYLLWQYPDYDRG